MSEEIRDLTRRRVGGVAFTVLGLGEAIRLVVDLAKDKASFAAGRSSASVLPAPGLAVHFANAYTIALADADETYAKCLESADLIFTDGTPVVWAGRKLHPDVADEWTRVYGPDLMQGVFAQSSSDGPSHYMLGGSEETLETLRRSIARRWPDARIVGTESPPFRPISPSELQERDRRIVESGATMVWVGLGTPKQDVEVRRLAASTPVIALAVGAAFDFIAGTKSQAPVWMQRSGTEWLFRLATEPRRLGRRYLWGNPRFLLATIRHRGDETRSRALAGESKPVDPSDLSLRDGAGKGSLWGPR